MTEVIANEARHAMTRTIRVLHLEDNPFDFRLVEQTLLNQGLTVVCHRASDLIGLKTALDSCDWDVVLTDYNMPGMAFSSAVSLVRERLPDRPLIVVSGCLGEDMAVALLKHGVCDFVLKGSLVRLGTAVRRSLQEAADKRALADAEKLLRESEERLRQTLTAVDLVVWELTLGEGSFLETGPVDKVFSRPPGYRHGSLVALLADIHPEDANRFLQTLRRLGEGNSGYSFAEEFRIEALDGSVRWLKAAGALLLNSDSSPQRLLGTVRDVTARKAMVAELHDQNELHKTLIEAIPSPIFHKDMQGRYSFCNKAFEGLLQLPRDQIIGKSLADLTLMVNLEPHQAADATLLAGKKAVAYDARVHRPDGTWKDLHLSKAVYHHEDGTAAGIVGIMIDITERKRIDARLRKLGVAVDQSPCSIVITDTKGTIVYVNPAFCTATGYSTEEAVGSNPRILKSGFSSEADYQSLWQTISSGKVWHGELHNRRKNGTVHWESVSISPVHNEMDVITHFVAIKEDISDRKTKEIELIEAKERAESANLARYQFMTMMNHELHTPLNAIIGFADIMSSEPDGSKIDNKYKDYCAIIAESGQSLLTLLNDILRLSKLAGGDAVFDFEWFPLGNLIKGATDTVRSRAEASCVHLIVNYPELGIHIDCDERALNQALVHILANAIKFSRYEGEVKVSHRLTDDGSLELIIIDSGIGIAKADIQKAL